MDAASVLGALLLPVTPEEFATSYWGRKLLFLPGSEDRARLLDYRLDDFWRTTDRPGIRIVAQFHGQQGHHEIVDLPGATARGLFAAGMSIEINDAEKYDARLQRLASEARLRLGYPGQVSVVAILSPAGGGFGLHFDHHGGIAIQLEGLKRWHHSHERTVETPMRNVVGSEPDIARYNAEWPSLPCRAPRDDEMTSHALQPGALLYLPPGTWHRPVAEEYSLALTIVFWATRFESLISRLIREKHHRHVGWRQVVPLSPDSTWAGETLPSPIEAFVESRLEELRSTLSTMSAKDFGLAWRQMISDPQPYERGRAEESPPKRPVEQNSRVYLSHSLWFARSNKNEEMIHLYGGHQIAVLPEQTTALVRELCGTPERTAHELFQSQDALEWEEVTALLSYLRECGMIEIR